MNSYVWQYWMANKSINTLKYRFGVPVGEVLEKPNSEVIILGSGSF